MAAIKPRKHYQYLVILRSVSLISTNDDLQRVHTFRLWSRAKTIVTEYVIVYTSPVWNRTSMQKSKKIRDKRIVHIRSLGVARPLR